MNGSGFIWFSENEWFAFCMVLWPNLKPLTYAKTNVLNGNPFVYFLAVVFEMRNFAIHL